MRQIQSKNFMDIQTADGNYGRYPKSCESKRISKQVSFEMPSGPFSLRLDLSLSEQDL